MDPNSVLAQLRDIQPPEAISAWPPAIGWWLLAIIVLCALGTTIFLLRRWYRRTAWKRAALKELGNLETAYYAMPNSEQLSRLNALLRRSLAAAYGLPSIAALGPVQWREQLNEASHYLTDDDLLILSEGHYQAQQTELDKAAFKRIKRTIKEVR
jgi:hypothetical protein